jgi:hypothetical protein
MTKKNQDNPTQAGAVELEEKELDEVQGAGLAPTFKGGVRVAASDINGDERFDNGPGKFSSQASGSPNV